MHDVAGALFFTTLAGLSTGLGSVLAIVAPRSNRSILSLSLGFSAGVMLYISFMELLPVAREEFDRAGTGSGMLYAVLAFFGGIIVVALIDRLVPERVNPHESHDAAALDPEHDTNRPANKLFRLGVLTALSIGLHNFPEGAAVFFSNLSGQQFGWGVTLAVALHNIPEGLAVALPVYFATGSRRKALLYSFSSGLAEPIGAVIGYTLLLPFLGPTVMGISFAAVAGIMVFLSLDSLLPSALAHGRHHEAVYSVMAGMALMAASLLMLG
jgi:ZIP family zinc transporter